MSPRLFTVQAPVDYQQSDYLGGFGDGVDLCHVWSQSWNEPVGSRALLCEKKRQVDEVDSSYWSLPLPNADCYRIEYAGGASIG